MSRPVSFRHVSAHPIHIPEQMEITLTDVEDQLCNLLDECTKHLAESKGITTTCRIAGGWVRDKLIGSQSNDMDVALTDMMGYPFAVEFSAFVSEVKEIPVKSVCKVKENPGQSKHLETAKTSVLDTELDFVNLRDEQYAEDSRIPTASDALRRDITINSLFYNVHSRSIEDHCGKGLDDLRNGFIRTPLPPRQTFLDDPLRVVRCIRFASRFGFKLVPELEESARDPEMQAAITQKITRERVGEEIDKMMIGRDPYRSIQLIDSLSLSSTVFHIPSPISSTLSHPPTSSASAVAAAAILQTFLRPDIALFPHPPLHPLLLSVAPSSRSITARLYLACALTPYRGSTYLDHRGREHLAVEAAIREGLKIGTKHHYLDGIPLLYTAAELLKQPKLDDERFKNPSERVAIGLLLRNPAVHNPLIDSHWTVSLLFALVQDLVPLYDVTKDTFDVERAKDTIQTYNTFVTRIEELGLDKAVDAKPILDGHEVVTLLGAAKPGQWTGRILHRVIEWQLEHPQGTKDDCAEWLRAEKAAGKLVLEDTYPVSRVKRGKNGDKPEGAKKSKR